MKTRIRAGWVGSGNLFLLLLEILVQLCIVLGANAQNLKPVKVMYSYETMGSNGESFTYKLFYIIREQQKEIDGKKYNLFTFSSDSNYVNGYIRYDSADCYVNFLTVFYKEGQPRDDGMDKEHRLFSFVSDSTECNYIGGLRGYFNIVSQTKPGTDSVFMKVIPVSRIPDLSYVEELIFVNRLYPCSIVVSDVLLGKIIKINGQILSAQAGLSVLKEKKRVLSRKR